MRFTDRRETMWEQIGVLGGKGPESDGVGGSDGIVCPATMTECAWGSQRG